MTELSDDELERRMRRKLFLNAPSSRGQSFTGEEQRIAAKLLGTSEAQRLQNRRDNSRLFKPKKPVVVVEYYEVPPMQCNYSSAFSGGWRIDVRENGVVQNSRTGLSREECLKLVADCERRGAKSKAIVTEWMKHVGPEGGGPKTRPASKRKSFYDRFDGIETVIES